MTEITVNRSELSNNKEAQTNLAAAVLIGDADFPIRLTDDTETANTSSSDVNRAMQSAHSDEKRNRDRNISSDEKAFNANWDDNPNFDDGPAHSAAPTMQGRRESDRAVGQYSMEGLAYYANEIENSRLQVIQWINDGQLTQEQIVNADAYFNNARAEINQAIATIQQQETAALQYQMNVKEFWASNSKELSTEKGMRASADRARNVLGSYGVSKQSFANLLDNITPQDYLALHKMIISHVKMKAQLADKSKMPGNKVTPIQRKGDNQVMSASRGRGSDISAIADLLMKG